MNGGGGRERGQAYIEIQVEMNEEGGRGRRDGQAIIEVQVESNEGGEKEREGAGLYRDRGRNKWRRRKRGGQDGAVVREKTWQMVLWCF